MFDHVDIQVRDLNTSKRFYSTVLAPLGFALTAKTPDLIEFGALSIGTKGAAGAADPLRPAGHVSVEVAPSVAVRNGVYLAINDHYDITRTRDSEERETEVHRVLFDLWDASYTHGRQLADSIAHEIDGQSADA